MKESALPEIEDDSATPLCHHCLSPHDKSVDFCPDCGSPVGQYTNWLPVPLFVSRLVMYCRSGPAVDFKRTPLTIVGFILFGFVEYAVFRAHLLDHVSAKAFQPTFAR